MATKKANTHDHISQIWTGLRDAIDKAYKAGNSDESNTLRDYAQNVSWNDSLEKLLRSEVQNEKQHRGTRPVRGFSSQDAAKLIICNNVLRGTELQTIPSVLTFITFRPSAAEANLIGYLIREHVTADWKASVQSLDYSECMKSSEVR
jgi:hypothetical protein